MRFLIKHLLVLMVLASAFLSGYVLSRIWEKEMRSPSYVIATDPIADCYVALEFQFSPSSFFEDVEKLIGERRYSEALALMLSCNIEKLVEHNPSVFLAVQDFGGQNGAWRTFLPGIDREYSKGQDWIIPESSINSDSELWNSMCIVFARKYNQSKESKTGTVNNTANRGQANVSPLK